MGKPLQTPRQAPAEFAVLRVGWDFDKPRVIRAAPNGDWFIADGMLGTVHVLRVPGKDGRTIRHGVFAAGLKQPFGIAFYPPGNDPSWVYIADVDGVVRFPYENGDLKASGKPERIVEGMPIIHDYAHITGHRNCEGMTVQPETGELWCIVNEQGELGDDTPSDTGVPESSTLASRPEVRR